MSGPRVLIIEGGGMKGAYANGVLTAFEDAGLYDWDVVMGTSAGGAFAAWFSAKQARFAQQTWKYALDQRILSYRRLLLRQPILDHEALLDIVYDDEHPIDQVAVSKAPWRVVVTASDIDTGACVYQDIRNEPIIPWLKATGRLPLASGPPVTIHGRRYIDGGVVDPVPIRHAVEIMGAKHVTLVLNTPPGPRKSDARFIAEFAARRFPKLRDGLLRHQEIKAAAIEYAYHPPPGVHVDVIRPDSSLGIHRLSRDMKGIEAALARGHRDGAAYAHTLLATAQASAQTVRTRPAAATA